MAERKSLVNEVAQLRKDMALGANVSRKDELEIEDLSGVNFIVKKFKLHQLSTGELLRKEINNKTNL